MTYTLTTDQKKRLTEFLGERYEEWEDEDLITHYPRIFTTPDDRQALCEKLMENGMWGNFYDFAQRIWMEEEIAGTPSYEYWLLVEKPERFAWLCNKFLEVENGQK
jgi:hypothetical protein